MRQAGKARARAASALLAAVLSAAGLAGCAPQDAPEGNGGSSASSALSGTVTVFAAASLKSTFSRLADQFEAAHPGTKVALSFAGSSDLVTQISQGAPADVFAAADARNMAKLADAGLLGGAATDFATNTLEIAVPPANPASISNFADLARPGVRVVVCAPQVPCGAAAVTAEQATVTDLSPVSEESSVTDVLGKVISGEADAGLVYATDVRAAGAKVTGIPFAESAGAVNTYPVAVVGSSRNKQLAAAFVALVTGDDGRKVFIDAGFGAP